MIQRAPAADIGVRRVVTARLALAFAVGLIALGILVRLAAPGRVDWVRATLIVFGSLLIRLGELWSQVCRTLVSMS